MTSIDTLTELAALIKQLNQSHNAIAKIIGRPAIIGHVGEFLAQGIFGIKLHDSAVEKGSDGLFSDGPLAGKSVNVKFYTRQEGILDVHPENGPDYYLALTGPRSAASSSKGKTAPWVIEAVYLFDAAKLVQSLQARGLKIGVATSVRNQYWEEAEIYPQSKPWFPLTEEQRSLLRMFSAASIG